MYAKEVSLQVGGIWLLLSLASKSWFPQNRKQVDHERLYALSWVESRVCEPGPAQFMETRREARGHRFVIKHCKGHCYETWEELSLRHLFIAGSLANSSSSCAFESVWRRTYSWLFYSLGYPNVLLRWMLVVVVIELHWQNSDILAHVPSQFHHAESVSCRRIWCSARECHHKCREVLLELSSVTW